MPWSLMTVEEDGYFVSQLEFLPRHPILQPSSRDWSCPSTRNRYNKIFFLILWETQITNMSSDIPSTFHFVRKATDLVLAVAAVLSE